MGTRIIKLFRTIVLLAACFLITGSMEAKAEDNPYSQMTMLDLSKGAIIINTDSITGYDKDGTPVTAVNAQGYHIICSTYGTSNKITVEPGVDTTIVADNLNITIYSQDYTYPSPLFIRPGASVTLILEGENRFSGSDYNAAIGVPQAADGTMAELTIEGKGSAYCTTGKRGAGIGGGQRCGYTDGAGIITINSGTIKAIGGDYGGGIGNSEGEGKDNCRITINGGTVYAQSNNQSSGIGGTRTRRSPKSDIIINGGVIYSASPDSAIRGSTLEMNGGNVISCQNNSSVNWQSFNPSPVDKDGNSIRIASVQLDSIDADRELSVTCGGRNYTVFSDDKARVNILLFQGDRDDITIQSESGNEYVMDYGTLATPTTITDRPYRYPLLTITPDSGQTSKYGDSFVPSYKVYDDGSSLIGNTDAIITGNPAYEKIPSGSSMPYNANIVHGNLRVIDRAHCITFTENIKAEIQKRPIQVSAQDLEVYDGQYNKDNLPFIFRVEEGSLAPGDTIENAFTFSAESSVGIDYFPAGEYTDISFTFRSPRYDVSLKGRGPTLTVLENECLLKQGEILTIGTDTDGNPVTWVIMNVTDRNVILYSEHVYDNETYDQAKDIRNQSVPYILGKIPDLANYNFIQGADVLDSSTADMVYKDGGMKNAGAVDIGGNPAKYWMYTEENPPYNEKAIYMDEYGSLQEAADSSMTAALRMVLDITTRSHTVPVITLSDKMTSTVQYGDITDGTKVAEVKDGANLSGHELVSFNLLDKSTSADSFTLKDDGTIVADHTLTAGNYTLYVQSEDKTGYKMERSVTFTVRQRQLEIMPQSGISMHVGDAVPQIPYTYDSSRLLSGDTLTGSLVVDGDLSVAGQYPITIGTLSAGDNYQLILAGGVNLNVLDAAHPGTGSGSGDSGSGGTGMDEKGSTGDTEKSLRCGKAAPTGDNGANGMVYLFLAIAAVSAIACRKDFFR